MKVTFDFRSVQDALDFHTMSMAFSWQCTLEVDNTIPVYRIVMNHVDPNRFGAIAGEAGVFAPVQITVEP